MSGFRRYGRKPLRCAIKFSHSSGGDFQAETQDISDAGIFIRDSGLVSVLNIGEVLSAKLQCNQDAFEDTKLKVVRMTADGVGLEFD